MELLPLAGLLMNAPRAVGNAMDLAKRIRDRDKEKVDIAARVQALEEDSQAAADLVAQNAQAINELVVRLDATSRRVRLFTVVVGALGLIAITALAVAVTLLVG